MENDITPVDMIRLMALLPDIGGYELSESRIPYDGLFTSQNEMLVPDFAQTKSGFMRSCTENKVILTRRKMEAWKIWQVRQER
ncbi:MAG: hypothetical protein ACLTSZ_03420 [Lachnospiraceae bacterium]